MNQINKEVINKAVVISSKGDNSNVKLLAVNSKLDSKRRNNSAKLLRSKLTNKHSRKLHRNSNSSNSTSNNSNMLPLHRLNTVTTRATTLSATKRSRFKSLSKKGRSLFDLPFFQTLLGLLFNPLFLKTLLF